MSYTVYVLYSDGFDKYYIGHTNDLKRRVEEHNGDKARYTKPYQPWKLIFKDCFLKRSEAMQLEKHLKSIKNKEVLKKYIAGWRSSTSRGS